jgi:2-polyprenyl-3-methyl-5-hydroxy-6-metoxy-1,4-benzoquinol methylase
LNESDRCPACGAAELRSWRGARASDRRASAPVYTLVRCSACGTAITPGRTGHDARDLDRGGVYNRPSQVVDDRADAEDRLQRDQAAVLPGEQRRRARTWASSWRPSSQRRPFVVRRRRSPSGAPQVMQRGCTRGGAYAPPPAAVDLLLEVLRHHSGCGPSCAWPGPTGARVIEIGYGDGRLFGSLAEQKCTVVAIEPYAAQGDMGPEVLGASAEGADVVVLWPVLKHLDDPVLRLRGAVGALGRNGRIVVSVPNLDSLQARIGGRRWFHLDVPRHAGVHFTRRGLIRLIERCGLAVTRIGNGVLDQNLLAMSAGLGGALVVHPERPAA